MSLEAKAYSDGKRSYEVGDFIVRTKVIQGDNRGRYDRLKDTQTQCD